MVDLMLRLEHVAMRYGQGPLVLHDINLTLGRGDFVLVTGPTGAGKTFSGQEVARMGRRDLGALRR